MNSFIQAYRAQNPTYEGDDDALTLRYGDEYPPGQYQYPDDFVSEYNRLNSQRQVNQSSIGEEAKRGVSRGVQGLESTVEGGLALGSDLIGADRLKKYFLQKYADTSRDMEQTAAPSVPKIEDVNSFSSGAQYLAGKVGEFLPNIGEAAATAAIGTAVAPGPGTAEGAAAGFFAKTATRSALSKALKATLTPEVKEQLEQYVAGKITGKELGAEAAKLVTDSSKILGGTAASLANFAGIGAGAQYGNLANTPGVTDEDAVTGALIAGAGSSIGALIPGRALKALFPGVEETAAKSYVDLWAKKIPVELMTASGGMGAMEFFNIVSEKYADPKKRDEDFSKDDWSRMFNALAAGTLMGVPTSTIHALRGVKTPENIEPLKENPDATLIGAQPENGQQKYPGNSPIVPVEGDNRILPAEEQTAGDQASGGHSAVEGTAVTPAAEAAAELTPEAKAVIEQKTGKTPEEIAAQAGTGGGETAAESEVTPGTAATPPTLKRARVEVPETPPEPMRDVSVVEEIRQKGADTKQKIKAIFPQLSNEEAAALRRQAFPLSTDKPNVRFSMSDEELPPIPEQSESQIKSSYNEIVQTLQRSGIPVATLQSGVRPLFGSLAQSLGAFDRAGRTAVLALKDITAPTRQDLRVLIEEASHAVFDKLPSAVKERVLRAMNRLDEDSPEALSSVQRDVEAAYPSGFPNDAVRDEEVAMGLFSRKLVDEGFDPLQSRGIAQQILRTVKDLYYKTAMWFQSTFLGPQYASPALAQKFFENRMRSFLSGDQEPTSLIDMLGGRKATTTEQLQYSIPAQGENRNLLQVYNPVSGQIDQNPVLIDSVEAALLNLRNDPNTRFSIPAPGAPPQQYVPPEIRLNRMAGTNNKIQDVREEIGQRAEVDPELYRKLNGLQDRVRIKQSFDANAQARNVTGYKPDQAIEDFSHETDSGPAYRDASRLLQEEHSKVGQTLDKDRVTKAGLEIQRLQDLKDLNRQTDAFKDAGFMSGLVQKGLKNIVKDDIRGLLRTSKTLGAITQQYNDLAGRTGAPDPRYINALERLYDGNALNGQRMFDVLDLMANDPAIDLNQRASVIREQMRMRAASVPIPLYESLIQDTPDSRTLLATVIAYGRINRRDMALLEARRMRSGEDRAQLEQDLRNLQRENVEKLTKGIGSVSQAGGVEAVAKQEYRRALLQMSLTNRTLKNLEDRIGLNEKALPVYRRNIDEIAGKITETNDITFGDQMTIRVPTLKANGAVDWNNETINLRSTADNPTSSQELKATLDKLLAFTKDREDQAKAGSTTALGQDYQDANRAALEILDNRFYQHALRTTDHYAFELFFSDAAKQIESLGTPTATFMGRKLRQFVAETTQSRTAADRKFGFTNQRNKDALMGIINRSRKRGDKVDAGIFTRFVIDPALGFLEKQQPREGVARETDVNQAFSNLRQWLSGNDHTAGLIGRKNFDQFMPQLRKFIEGVYESGQFWRKKVTDAGQLVKDPKLFDKLRKHFDVGLFTFQRRLSDTFTSMVEAMKNSGWGAEEAIKADFNQVAEMLKKGDTAGVDQMLDKYTNHSVHGPTTRDSFLHPLFHTPDESVFEAPALDASGTKVPMDPLMAAQAHDMASRSGGGLRQAIENMYDLSGGGLQQGGQSKEDYVQTQLFNLLTTFKGAHTANEESKPQSGPVRSFVGMIPNAMIDAREFSHWPSEWFTYHDFDKNENARMAERVAGQLVYGRDNRILDNAYKTLQAETDSFVAKFKAIQEQAQRYVPNNDPKKIQAASEQLLERDNSPGLSQFKTGKEKYRFLKQTQQRSGIVPKFLNEMSDYYGRRNQDEGSLKWGTRFAQFLARLLPNNPGSAIMQMATLFDVPAAWGASPSMLKLTGRVVQIAAKDLAGSLAQGVGFKLLPLSPYEEKFRDFVQDSEVARRFGDLRSVLEGEENAPVARRLRQLSDLLSAPVNRLGENAPFTPLRPLSPFFQMIMSSNRALTVGTWELADRYVNKAAEFIRNNPGAKEVTAKDIGLGRLDSDGYDRLTQSMARYGLDMHELGTEANKFLGQGRKTVLSDKTLARLYSMALNEVSLESNIATMPLGAFNSSTVRFIAPLLGWSFRRSLQLFGKRLDANDRLSMTAMRNALLGLSATALGGLGVSLAAGAYQNDVLGKKQNIRDLRVPQNLNDLIAIEERLARTGTFGLFGDLVNSVVNTGTGQGDNRAFSVDQRVVALQSMQGLINAASSYINQDFDADYSHVMRPAIAAMGGNGLLQYMQIANRMFDFDNAESRLVKRINAQNYLRVVGRDLGMEMKKSSGGYATPTPITPWISRMELAAYANNPDDFRAARQGAIEEAKASGKPDPIEYVKRTFEGHHPLRNVFNTVPSVKEYRQILQNLDEDGQTDVKEAVRLFNHYGSFIGIQPFEGSAKKDQQNSPQGLAQAQIRALSKIGSMR